MTSLIILTGKKMNYSKQTELELKKQAVKFDKEIVYWMRGIRLWVFLFVAMCIIGFFFAWINIGALAVGIYAMYLIRVGMKAKNKNIEENQKEINEVKNAKK